jgi:allantoinase
MAAKPAELARLNTKGQLALGYDADFAIFAADDAYVVDVTKFKHKNPHHPLRRQGTFSLGARIRRLLQRRTAANRAAAMGRQG